MGKRGHNKSSVKKEQLKEAGVKCMPARRRNEVTQLADKLLRISTQPPPENITKAFELHNEIDDMLLTLINIEASIDVSTGKRCNSATISKFTKWVEENGAKFEGLSIEEFPGYELGIKTERDITEGSLVISVPRKLMMTLEAAKKSVIGALMEKDKMLQNMPNVALAMFLLVEKFTPNSFWKPYIDILPKSYTTVLYFTKEELLEIRESPTFESALNLIKSIARQYAYFNKLVQSCDDPAAEILRNVFTYKQYRWAVSTIMTRQNSVPAEDGTHMINALIPLWDLCNHTNGNITTEYNPEQHASECLAVKDFKKGDQLFIFYGIRSNADLFIHNGFVYEDNAHDGYWLKLSLNKSDALYEKRSTLLERIGLSVHGEFWLKPETDPIPGQLLGFLRVLYMEQDHLHHWLSNERYRDLINKDCSLEMSLIKKIWVALKLRLGIIQALYKTKLSEDLNLVNEKSFSPCKKLAIQMRITEKRILQNLSNYVEEQKSKYS